MCGCIRTGLWASSGGGDGIAYGAAPHGLIESAGSDASARPGRTGGSWAVPPVLRHLLTTAALRHVRDTGVLGAAAALGHLWLLVWLCMRVVCGSGCN